MTSFRKLSVSILFTVVLSTGFLSITYVQRAHAFSIDFSGLLGFGDNQGFNFLQGPKGDKGDTGPQGPQGEQGHEGAPCPHQSQLVSHASGGITVVHPTPGESPFNVCVP